MRNPTVSALFALCAFGVSGAAQAVALQGTNLQLLHGDWCLLESRFENTVERQHIDFTFDAAGNYRFQLMGAPYQGKYVFDSEGVLRVGPYYFSKVDIAGDTMTAEFAGDSVFARGKCPVNHDVALWAELVVAIREGKSAAVEAVLARGIGLDDTDPTDMYALTPLLVAVKSNQAAIAQMLLNKGADPNKADAADTTPLMRAAQDNQLQLVTLLLDKGADPNRGDSYKRTPLFWAIGKGGTDVVRRLLEKGADPNIQATHVFDGTKISLLNYASDAKNPNPEIVRLLKSHGAK